MKCMSMGNNMVLSNKHLLYQMFFLLFLQRWSVTVLWYTLYHRLSVLKADNNLSLLSPSIILYRLRINKSKLPFDFRDLHDDHSSILREIIDC